MTLPTLLAWIPLAAPLALVCLGLVPAAAANRRPGLMANSAMWAAGLALLCAVTSLALHIDGGPLAVTAPVARLFHLGVYVDAVSAPMFVLVAFVGLIVARYSRTYLAGDPGHGRFTKWLNLTLAAVLLLIVSGTMVQFVAAWVATSLCLHQLLLFYRERPAAVMAARKKFVASRMGDACLIAAGLLLVRLAGADDLPSILAAVRGTDGAAAGPLSLIALLLAGAALLKSAQFPFHGWLLEVMETPTPVSALLHAGLVNAGGYLVLRFAPAFTHAPAACDLLLVFGAVTALFGAVVMLTQTSIKAALAYSTIAQMGFMMIECGLGAFPAALLHIVGHSLYKAHAFLSSGGAVALARAPLTLTGPARPWRAAATVSLALAATWAIGATFGVSLRQEPGTMVLGAVLLLGLASYLDAALTAPLSARALAIAGARALGVGVAYFALHAVTAALTRAALPVAAPSADGSGIAAAVIAAFAAVTAAQSLLPRMGDRPWVQALYVHLANGLYVNTVFNRLALRLWPAAAPQPLGGN